MPSMCAARFELSKSERTSYERELILGNIRLDLRDASPPRRSASARLLRSAISAIAREATRLFAIQIEQTPGDQYSAMVITSGDELLHLLFEMLRAPMGVAEIAAVADRARAAAQRASRRPQRIEEFAPLERTDVAVAAAIFGDLHGDE